MASVVERTVEGESGIARFMDTTFFLSSDAGSASFWIFVREGTTERIRSCLTREAKFSFPSMQMENPLSCAAEGLNVFRSEQMALRESM